ncbi:MAG: polysaccharide deacetylase family protein, partial [Spirochaetaceae bacterium]|nr:polysaccharide deacetylase family protein [Spirochaetaceae bacterium]
MKNRAAAAFIFMSLLIGLVLTSCDKEDQYIQLPGVQGPLEESRPVIEEATPWESYSRGGRSRLAVYLHDDDSPWLGLVHGLKSIGVPFLVTDSLEAALEHSVVLTYPRLRKKDLEDHHTAMLHQFVRDGGVLLGTLIDAEPLYGLFGFEDLEIGRNWYEITYAESEYTSDFIYPRERTIRIGNPDRPKTFLRSIAYSHPQEVLAEYDDGSAAIVRRKIGEGEAIAVGFDLGFYIKKAQNNRDEEAGRAYVNEFEPSVDTVLRYIKNIYRMNEPLAATLHTAPDGYPLSVIISHDVDYSGSLANSITYAEYQRSMGYGATYFMQTKYFEDFFDEVFFDERTTTLLTELEQLDMELGSHSVSHTDMFARVPRGNYRESYPDYQPRIIEFFYTRDATVTGEIRVSKFLIEELSDSTVVSFRPGFLANPSSLPEVLQAAGYRYSSTVTANDVMTHLPFRQTYGRGYDMELSVYEFPITVEDEKPPEMDQRLDEAVELA